MRKPVAFMPNGSFIAGFHESEKNEIILWEKNGL